MDTNTVVVSPFAQRVAARLKLDSVSDLPVSSDLPVVPNRVVKNHLASSPMGLRRATAESDLAAPAETKSFTHAVNELGIEFEKEMSTVEQVRRALAVMRLYKAPTVKEEDRKAAEVEWPAYTIWNYEKDITGFAEQHQLEATTTFADAATQVSVLAERMKKSVESIIGLLGTPVTNRDVQKQLLFIESSATRGTQLVEGVQRYIVDMNHGIADLGRRAKELQGSHEAILVQLKKSYNDWAKKEQRKPFDDLEQAAKELRADIEQLQKEINEKERDMIIAGSVGGPCVIFFGLGMLACAIVIAVKGAERQKLIDRITPLQQRAAILTGALGVKVFVDNVHKDLEAASTLLGLLQRALDAVGSNFMHISKKFHEVRINAGDNHELIEAGLGLERKDLEAISISLEEIIRTAEGYRKNALGVEIVLDAELNPQALVH